MTPNTRGVAVVTVHGVADQQPGQTVRELARLLCHGADGPPRYGEGETHEVLIPVAPLPPHSAHPVPDAPAAPGNVAKAAPRVLPRPGAASEFYRSEATPPAAAADAGDLPRTQALADLGIKLTDYLLSRYRPTERDALYESTRISLKRRRDGTPVDLYELYWADYSRLKPGGVRALSALYQLFFHLNTLARDVIDQVLLAGADARSSTAWRVLQRLHAWSAWLQRGPAALVQLAMLLLVPFGAAGLVPAEQQHLLLAGAALAAAAILIGLALFAYFQPKAARRSLAVPLALGALACLLTAAAVFRTEQGFPKLYVVAIAVGLVGVGVALVRLYGRLAQDVRGVGYAAIAALLGLLIYWAERDLPQSATMAEWMVATALHSGEVLLVALLVAWTVLVCVQMAAVLLGFVLARSADERIVQSIITARIGMVVSTALFASLSLVLWSMIVAVAGPALDDLLFEPALLGEGYRRAQFFLEQQVRSVGALFTPLILFGSAIGIAALVALAPALREEFVPTRNLDGAAPAPDAVSWSRRLGAWWTRARRFLGSLFGTAVPALAVVGGFVYLAFMLQLLLPAAPLAWPLAWLDYLQTSLPADLVSFVTAGKWLAGGAVTITALGAHFTETFGKLRVALDAVLDVDNYFRDPADALPPRARIFSRFAALLDYLRERGYERVVIVAHSQGTVISADLLHYLCTGGRLRALVGAPLALVTVGSPLRDLYATRFPLLYRWLGAPAADFAQAAPGVDQLGVTEWVNAYRAGDYVGRGIWTPLADPRAFDVATPAANGQVAALRASGRVEFCLGAGAHTHYFSNDAVALAIELDRLIGAVAPDSTAIGPLAPVA
jgi:hypothetical protein